MADAGVQPDGTGRVGRGADPERALRPALHLRDLWHGAVLYAHGNRNVPVALEAAGNSAALPVHGISVAARHLRADRRRVDAEHNYHPAHASVLGNGDRAHRGAWIFVLEAQWSEGCSSGVDDV